MITWRNIFSIPHWIFDAKGVDNYKKATEMIWTFDYVI